MESGLDTISYYFEEGKRLWAVDPERVTHKDFYELWESVQQPKPFLFSGNKITLFDQTFDLASDETERIAYFSWDTEEECPALIVDGNTSQDKFLLTFDDGDPKVYETEPRYFEKIELEYGERLEIIYDVIAWIKANKPNRNVLNLTKNEFLEALEAIKVPYERFAINVMKRLSATFIKSLVKKAADDMATDELSAQLSLPLDGNYATTFDHDSPAASEKKQSFSIAARTYWTALNEMQLLKMTCQFAAEAEKTFVLDLREAEVLEEDADRDLAIKVPADPEMPLREGELLDVHIRGEKGAVGTFKIDIFDGCIIYGRLRYGSRSLDSILTQNIYATLKRSPSSYIAVAVDELHKLFVNKAIMRHSVINYLLGTVKCNYTSYVNSDAPKHMDTTQKRAWTTALHDDNPLVLIQGPPGTGKTSVLEHILRGACKQGKRILVTAPSNTAVDNICRRVFDLPVLRFGNNKDSISPDVCDKCWVKIRENVFRFSEQRRELNGAGIYAGTHVGLMKNTLIMKDIEQNGLFDMIIFDEAGMSHFYEFVLCANLGKRAVIIGDHQQLPPFPMPDEIYQRLHDEYGVLNRNLWSILKESALEWLLDNRNFPIIMLQQSYRCQNPRLLRFCSTLFYDAGIKTSDKAEYYQLSYHDRHQKYPPQTLSLYDTSKAPGLRKRETITFSGNTPGIQNELEAEICVNLFYELLKKYPLNEITIISPYKKQTRLIREMLCPEKTKSCCQTNNLSQKEWNSFIHTRIATVDSFQGGESDVVIISYVRSNNSGNIGFVDDPNRINVTHTRCRREMIVIADMDYLKEYAKNNIFHRMERAIKRDGVIIDITQSNYL